MQSHICRVHVRLAVTCHLHFQQNDQDLLLAKGGMDTEIRVSTESWTQRRKFSHRSNWDLNPQPFDHKSSAQKHTLSYPSLLRSKGLTLR